MNISSPIDWTKHPLHVAAMSGNRTEVERLLAEGNNVNEQLELAGAPLHVATCNCSLWDERYPDHVEVVQSLLANGADIRSRRTYEGTPLHDAARRGLIRIAEILIAHGADVNSKEEDQRRTPLHRAVAEGQLHMVRYLVSRGAAVNAVADFDPHPYEARILPDIWTTPLHLAARAGDPHAAKILIEAGAVLDYRLRTEGPTSHDLALKSKREIVSKYDDLIKLLTA